jgi:HlyD family secretion protein
MFLGSRGTRFFVGLGIVLLLCTAIGAGWFFNQPATGTGPSSDAALTGVVAFGLGYVDVPDGITLMHPLQVGRVKMVQVKEGDEVKEGDLVLSVDNELQRLRLREALADLDAATRELADAQRLLPLNRENDIAIQKSKIEVLQIEHDAAKRELDKYKKSESQPNLSAFEDKLKAAKAHIEAEQALLKKIQDIDVIGPVERLKDKVKAKQALADQAQRAVFECDLYAPADGVILRLYATPGDTLSSQPRLPAIQFCPNVPRIVRAEILQEFAEKIQVGQIAYIEDDTRAATRWKGQVVRVPQWLSNRRSILFEPFQYNDVRMLECIVSIDAGGPPVRIGQRMRVIIKASGL